MSENNWFECPHLGENTKGFYCILNDGACEAYNNWKECPRVIEENKRCEVLTHQLQDLFGNDVDSVLTALGKILKYKNGKYGNSALHPIGVFSKAEADKGLYLRADDKVSRIKNSPTLQKNDVADLMGYLTLICIDKGWLDFSEFED